jgi:hypothetical protein
MCEIVDVIPNCGPNAPGVTELYWAAAEDIDTIPAVGTGTLVISTNITMEATKVFHPLVAVREETFLDEEMLGTTDSLHFKQMITLKVKGMTAAVDLALQKAAGAKCVIIAKFPDGTMRIIGNKTNYAEVMTMKGTTGKLGSTDKKGTDITIQSIGHITKAPYYTGTIPL